MPLNRLNKLYSSIVRGGEKRGRPTKNIPFGYSNTEWLLLTAELQDLRTKNAISQQFMAIILDTTQNKISDFENSKLYNEDMVLQYTLLFVDKPINFLCENAYIGLCCKKDDLINKIKIPLMEEKVKVWDEKRNIWIRKRLSELKNQKK